MSPATLVFEFPLPPNPNGSALRTAHWAKKRKARDQYWDLCDTLVQARRLPKVQQKGRWAKATATADVRTWREMDQDNGNSRMKLIWDWLQSRGYIVNDRAVRCELTPRAVPRKDVGITLTLEEVA